MTFPSQKVLQIWNPISPHHQPPQWLCQEWLLIEASNCQGRQQLGKQLMPWFGPKTETTEQKNKHAGWNGTWVASEGPGSYVTHFAYPAASSPLFMVVKLGTEFSANGSSDLPLTLFSPRRVPLRIYCPSNGPSDCKLSRKIVHGGCIFLSFGSGSWFGLNNGVKW